MPTLYFLFLIFYFPSASHGFNCTTGDKICEVCKSLGVNEVASTYYHKPICSIYIGFTDSNMTTESIPLQCEQLFNKFYPSSCQLAVLEDVELLGSYIQYGIRRENHSMLISLLRDGCLEDWKWYSRLENRTSQAGIGNKTEECDITQAAFLDFFLVRINPKTFTPSGILCQCTNRVAFLDSPPLVLTTPKAAFREIYSIETLFVTLFLLLRLHR